MLCKITNYITFTLLKLNPEAKSTKILNFFIYDSVKILLMIIFVMFLISLIRSYLPPEKIKKWLSHPIPGLSNLLASFFGAAMIAAAFAYFNYKFSEYKFVDFKEWVFYEKSDIFSPKEESYIVVFYSSKDKQSPRLLSNLDLGYPLLAIDYYNNIYENSKSTTFLRSSTKTSLNFIQRFNIYEVPSIFFIKKTKDSLYKQDSMIRKLDNLSELSNTIKDL